MILQSLIERKDKNIKSLAILVDPDKIKNEQELEKINILCESNGIDFILVGGSLLVCGSIKDTVQFFKDNSEIPVVLFPGSNLHIEKSADAILFLSLISGRNPDLLIGQHVSAAPILRKAKVEVLSTGYILVGNDANTTVAHISQTSPIPTLKPDIAICTAMAGEMLGMKLIYLDAGSGAKEEVPEAVIKGVHNTVDLPLIVGGGINTLQKVSTAYEAGADVIVLGSAVEKDKSFISEVARIKNQLNAKHS